LLFATKLIIIHWIYEEIGRGSSYVCQ